MPRNETTAKKRKACLTCTRAKAKCSASSHGPDCHRCHRLSKQCVFPDESIRKPGPKSRSRVKQLEQRVECLIDLISAKDVVENSHKNAPCKGIVPVPDSPQSMGRTGTPNDPPHVYLAEISAFQDYDPIGAGLIDEHDAIRLLAKFKTTFMVSFPFVVVDADAPTLRREQPFLFHAILAVTAYETPNIQYLLADELKRQIARMIEHSHKSMGMLQGLLVYTAWYHSFYHPVTQQLAIVIQLCVALVQDLGCSRNQKDKSHLTSLSSSGKSNKVDPVAGKRAFLGTYFLTVAFAQAWRKRTTLPFTRFMAQCCDTFAQSSIPTDTLISPLIKACELVSRVNDYFSYDDIENADVRGELMLEIATSNFRRELALVKDAASKVQAAKDNVTMNLMFSVLDIWIHECCLHGSLWQVGDKSSSTSASLVRLKMLHHTMKASTSYLQILLQLPPKSLYPLALQSWAGWFYAIIVTCKLVFLEDNERLGQTQFGGIPQEIDNLIPQALEDGTKPTEKVGTVGLNTTSGWAPLSVAQEYNVQQLFDQFMDLLSFTLPPGITPWTLVREKRDSLHAIACIQRTMLLGFTKRVQRFELVENTQKSDSRRAQCSHSEQIGAKTSAKTGLNPSAIPSVTNPTPNSHTNSTFQNSLPFAGFMNFDSLNFDGVTLPSSFPTQQNGFDDWIWDSVMDDFTMPSL
ncbi:hypothetical protein BKA66DRAFT_572409 [Pyrenochaeta sp. MPI-SDFR-AT-0127]|nr:hypothetical protein BKA66DRAFT_572409 [Pyrenochaeta sp. MPI-SDFR-AT-0127]